MPGNGVLLNRGTPTAIPSFVRAFAQVARVEVSSGHRNKW